MSPTTPTSPSASRRATDPEAGYTLVEIMVAMAILLFGTLGTLILVTGSFASTSATTAREQGTSLARDLIERSRQIAYKDLKKDSAPATLRGALPASDVVGPLVGSPNSARTFTVTRRGVVYTVGVTACSIDDPTDGAGFADETFCAPPKSTDKPGTVTPGFAVGANILGVSVNLNAPLLNTLCAALGGASPLLGTVTNVVNTLPGASIQLCPDRSDRVAVDTSAPDDLRRVRVNISWNKGVARSVSQTTLLTNPDQG